MSTTSVLVTGGAGYIGGHAALALLDRGERVVVLDDLSESEASRVPKGATFVEGSVGDAALVAKTIAEHNIEAVMHFAGFIRVGESVQNPEKYFKNNTDNTRTLAETVSAAGVRNFIFSSTAAVYGNPATPTVNEDSPCAPINPYGESKLRAEKILLALAEKNALRPVILRYFNVAGADPWVRAGYRLEENPSHLIRACLTAALHDRPFTLNGTDFATQDGSCIRDYIHVTDLANAHLKALDYLRAGGAPRIFNCGNGKGVSNLQVVAAVEKAVGKKMQIIRGPRREGDPAALTSDASRIRRELGWDAEFTDINGMVQHQLAWIKSQMQKA